MVLLDDSLSGIIFHFYLGAPFLAPLISTSKGGT